MDFIHLLDEVRAAPGYAGQVQHLCELAGREAAYADLSHPLHPAVEALLCQVGVERLWTHQAEAIDRVRDGQNVVVAAATASGKTLCYTIPLVEQLTTRPATRALLVFPTKALAQDQLRKLETFGAGRAFRADTFDGDTPDHRRRRIKREVQVVLTNPDMLHLAILPHHPTWAEFFANLELVVLDEVHVYRGVFGSHTAQVMRRLRRIAAHYGSRPRFVCCSATIDNPRELCEALTGLPFALVDHDGAPQGRRVFVLWNPPPVGGDAGRRRSANLEAADLMTRLMRQGVRSICFALARRQAELILSYVRGALAGEALADRVMAYRGGYLPAERREIERRLFAGELLAVTSTSALEVGVDIGGLDAAILTGYPGSIASTWQQIGRAGRGKQDALAVLIGMVGGIHQYLMQHPEYVLGRSAERAIIDPGNRFILAGHLLCAAYELPVTAADGELFGPQMDEILGILAEHNFVARRRAWHWLDPDTYPAGQISIRSVAGGGYDIIARDPESEEHLLGTIDDQAAFRTVHTGAVYLHGGETYLVEELDIEARRAYVRREDVGYYTTPIITSEVEVTQVQECRTQGAGTRVCLGELAVKTAVVGYARRRQVTEQELGQHELSLPPRDFETVGVWIELGGADIALVTERGRDLMGTIHALEHAMIQLLPLFALCDPHDVGGVSCSQHPDLAGPCIFVYDGYPGGVGISETAFARLGELIAAVAQAVAACPCEDGCPSCVQAPDCGDGNRPLDKAGAVDLARHWLASWSAPAPAC